MPAVLAHDLDTITFYDSKGEFVGVRRSSSGKPIQVSSAVQTNSVERGAGLVNICGLSCLLTGWLHLLLSFVQNRPCTTAMLSAKNST